MAETHALEGLAEEPEDLTVVGGVRDLQSAKPQAQDQEGEPQRDVVIQVRGVRGIQGKERIGPLAQGLKGQLKTNLKAEELLENRLAIRVARRPAGLESGLAVLPLDAHLLVVLLVAKHADKARLYQFSGNLS